MRKLLADLRQGLMRELDQVEMINRDSCAGQQHPQCFPERCRGINCYGLNTEPPIQEPFDQPRPDSGVVPAVNNTKDLARIEVNDRRHPRFNPLPRARFRVFEEADGAETVFIDPEHPRPKEIHVGKSRCSHGQGLLRLFVVRGELSS